MSVVVISPFATPELYDKYLLAGVRSPGVVAFTGHDRAENWDIKDAAGNAGAVSARKGNAPIEFTATHSLVIDPIAGVDQEAEWDEFAKIIEGTISGATPKAVDIFHPDLARVGIKSVVKKRIGGFVRDGLGGVTVVVAYLEYKPPVAKTVTGAKGSGGSGTVITGNAAIDGVINTAKTLGTDLLNWF